MSNSFGIAVIFAGFLLVLKKTLSERYLVIFGLPYLFITCYNFVKSRRARNSSFTFPLYSLAEAIQLIFFLDSLAKRGTVSNWET